MAYRLTSQLLYVVLCFSSLYSQESIDTQMIKNQLELVFDRDQKTREGDSTYLMTYYDSCNQAYVNHLIKMYGWPGKSFVGDRGNYTIWLIIQHADLQTQEMYLPLLSNSVDQGESQPSHLALLQDRVLMRKGMPQLYGSQIVFNERSGEPEFYRIADEVNVNLRRSMVGLEPIEEYAEHFGIVYKEKEEIKKE